MDNRIIKMLPVKLTKDEWDDRARAVARLSDEIADAERRVDAEKEAAKARVTDAQAVVDGLSAKQRQLSRVVREGSEDREVACAVTLDRRKLVKVITRDDTSAVVDTCPISTFDARDGAEWKPNFERDVSELIHPDEPGVVLETRPLTDGERQEGLPGVEQPKGKKGKKNSAEALAE